MLGSIYLYGVFFVLGGLFMDYSKYITFQNTLIWITVALSWPILLFVILVMIGYYGIEYTRKKLEEILK